MFGLGTIWRAGPVSSRLGADLIILPKLILQVPEQTQPEAPGFVCLKASIREENSTLEAETVDGPNFETTGDKVSRPFPELVQFFRSHMSRTVFARVIHLKAVFLAHDCEESHLGYIIPRETQRHGYWRT